jgi:hypothetical protein
MTETARPPTPGDLDRIVSHSDFDGVASASLLTVALGVGQLTFTGPAGIIQRDLQTGPRDAVADLPYPPGGAGAWFDHHGGNLEELRLRGIDPAAVPGAFAEKPSCARVIFDLFGEGAFPDFVPALVAEADVIDSFAYGSLEEWRGETPGKIVDCAIKSTFPSLRHRDEFLRRLASLMWTTPIDRIAVEGEVPGLCRAYRKEEEQMLSFLAEEVAWLQQDAGHEVVVLDLVRHNRLPRVTKSLVFLLEPQALAVMEIKARFLNGVKTVDMNVSVSLSPKMNAAPHGKDLAEILRSLNLGDGHPGAAAGTIRSGSKGEMDRNKGAFFANFWRLWSAQSPR